VLDHPNTVLLLLNMALAGGLTIWEATHQPHNGCNSSRFLGKFGQSIIYAHPLSSSRGVDSGWSASGRDADVITGTRRRSFIHVTDAVVFGHCL